MDEWIAAAKTELGIDLDVDTGVLLDLARDAAHGVARPAAPLTTFLVGYAAARAGGGPEAVSEAARKVAALARGWAGAAERAEPGGPSRGGGGVGGATGSGGPDVPTGSDGAVGTTGSADAASSAGSAGEPDRAG